MSTDLVIIRPKRGWLRVDLAEMFEYRELFYFLAWRDIKVRYKQTVLGAAWAIVQPFFTMVVFSIVFGRLAGIPSDDLPYPLFAYAGLLPWQLFSYGLTRSSTSVVAESSLITKVYFPRLIIPLSAVIGGIVDFLIASGVLLLMMVYYGVMPTYSVVWLPGFVILALCAALGLGIWLSALNVKYRDIRQALPFLAQLLLFATPVAYPSSLLPERFLWVYGLNPMTGVVDGFRWALLGGAMPDLTMLGISALVTILVLIGGVIYFTQFEREFADIV